MGSVVEMEAYEKSFMQDLIAALTTMDNPNLDGKANYGTYPTLGGCLAAAKAALAANNLALIQMVCAAGDGAPDRLVTRFIHTSGSFIEDDGVPLYCADRNNPQKMGSAITYARRYGLLSMMGCVGDDDDDGIIATPYKSLPQKQQTTEQKKVHEKVEPAPVPVVSDEIPFNDSDARLDYGLWVADAIRGFGEFNTIVMLQDWQSANTKTLTVLRQEAGDELADEMIEAYNQKEKELTNAQ